MAHKKGASLHPERPRLQRPAPRREALRRSARQRRRDHRPPARHPLPPRHRRRPWRRRHAVRARRRVRSSSAAAVVAASSTSSRRRPPPEDEPRHRRGGRHPGSGTALLAFRASARRSRTPSHRGGDGCRDDLRGPRGPARHRRQRRARCASVHREKFKPLGGPDGGNGGNGGDVILVVDPNVTTLLDYHHAPHRKADIGRPGAGRQPQRRAGRRPRPAGARRHGRRRPPTARSSSTWSAPGPTYVVAAGGRGGLGNAALASQRRKAPGFALLGEPGGEGDVLLELKTVADVGLVGFPSAGKSSLVAAISPPGRRSPTTRSRPWSRTSASCRRATPLHRRRRPRPHPGRQRGQGARPGVPAPRRALRRPGARPRLRDARARPRPGRATSTSSRRSSRRTAASPTARASSCSTRSTSPRPRSSPTWSPRPRGARLHRAPGVGGEPRGPARADLRDGVEWSQRRAPRTPVARAPTRIVLRPQGGRRAATSRSTREGDAVPGARRRKPRALGAADRLRQRRGRRLPRRPARPARRRGPAGRARRHGRAPRSSSAARTAGSSTGSPTHRGRRAGACPGPRGHRPAAGRSRVSTATCRPSPRPVVWWSRSARRRSRPAAGGIDAGRASRRARRRRWPPIARAGHEVGAWCRPARSPPGSRRSASRPAARPRDPAGGGERRPGAARPPLHRGVRPARHHRRPGAADRRRRRPALALPQRPAHAVPAARARRAAGRQRERHRGHRRDPASATTTGSPRWSPTSCTPTCSCCSPTSTASTTATRAARGAHAAHARSAATTTSPASRRQGRARPGVGTRRHGDQGRGGPDRDRRGHPRGADLGRPGGRGAGRRAGGHLLPRRRPRAARPGCCGWRTRARRWAG